LRHVAQPAAVSAYLLRIRVFADLRRHHRAYRQVAKVGVGIVDDLVRGFGAADRAADDVAGADLSRLLAVAQRARTLDDEEHFLLAAMAVERAGTLSRRHDVVRVAEILRPERGTDARRSGFELVAFGKMIELELVDVHHPGIDHAHRSISPNTISCEPMIATTSAIMWPRDISSSAARCGKPAARIFMR